MTYYASPAAYVQPTSASPATPPQTEGLIPYTLDSLRLGAQQLGNRLAQDFQNLDAYAQSTFPGANTANVTPAQQAAQLGPLAPLSAPLESLDSLINPWNPSYDPAATGNFFHKIGTWLVIGAGVVLLIELAPTINTLSSNVRRGR